MQTIRFYVVKLSMIFVVVSILLSLSSYSAMAIPKNALIQIPETAFSNKNAITLGGSSDDMGEATVVDGSGNVYMSGYFNGSVDFDPTSGVDVHISNGGRDVFLSKFNASGIFLWAKTWGGSGDERGESVVLDSLGNLYVSGPFQSTVDFNPSGGASHASNAGSANNIFLSKFNSDGIFQWVKTWGPSDGGAESYGLAIDGSNNVYVVGDFSGTTCDFNPWGAPDVHTNHAPTPGSPFGRLFDAYLSKFDSNGNFIWAKTWGGEGYDDGPGVAVDSLGNVYVGGMYASQTINFDPAGGSGGLGHPAHDSGILVDVFLSKFNSSGNFQWVKTWGGPGVDDVGQTMSVDGAGNIYLGGRFGCINCDFNPSGTASLHSSNGELDAFVSKFDPSGNFQWAKTWGGTGWDAVGGLITDSSNNVFVTGLFKNTVDFGSGSGVTSNGLMDVFLSEFNSSGSFQIVKTWGGTGDDGSGKPSWDAAGTIFVSGWFTGTVDFAPGSGGDIHTSNGSKDIFLETYSVTKPPSFADVPLSYWANSYIERLYSAGVTGGCLLTPLNYCPDNTVTRAEMAVFLLKGMHGSGFTPPVINGSTGFSDVTTGHWAAAWIKQLAAEGITSGCGAGIYCPEATVTRAQMALFLLKARHGSSYSPPAATGVFTDVPLGYWADKWIEKLAVEGITTGCGVGTYCPDASVTRAQMAVFLVKTFSLP